MGLIFESATPLLVGVALGGVALKCSKTHFLISAIYGPIWTKPMSINHNFFIDYIFIIFESATPLLVGVALGGVGVGALKLIFLSQPFMDRFGRNQCQSI